VQGLPTRVIIRGMRAARAIEATAYDERLAAMARFSAAYSRPDGGPALWGDADDARTLPLGRQPLGDHRYLAGLVGAAFDGPGLREAPPARAARPSGCSGRPRRHACRRGYAAAASRLDGLS
jgi:hypothetical protein